MVGGGRACVGEYCVGEGGVEGQQGQRGVGLQKWFASAVAE
jgi:hypothetical protein